MTISLDKNYNALVGKNAGFSLTSGIKNTFRSTNSGYSTTTGSYNVFDGYNAGYYNTIGNNSVTLGFSSGKYETASNSFYINNIDQTSTVNEKAYSLMYGKFSGIAGSLTGQELTINADLNINGRLTATNILEAGIGNMGQRGFGVGICPGPLPSGMVELYGTHDPASDNYGNYQYSDGSIMVWVPAFYYKYGTGSNGFAVNVVSIKSYESYSDVASANADGYALHRAFYDGGTIKLGVFVDKYLCSNNAGVASSILNGNPLSTNATHNPIGSLTVAPANTYYGTIDAIKGRGTGFFCATRFIHSMLAMLSLAHGESATSTTWCAWYDGAGITNYPKGCNNNALGDANDGSILYVSDGYSNAGKTGSANLFSRTTHNGQNCGICDLNGNMWEVSPGLTSDGTNYYLLNTSAKAMDMTSGNTLATDYWGSVGVTAHSTNLGTTFGSLWATGANRSINFGGAGQTLSEAVSGNSWNGTGAGIPLVVGGSNVFGNDNLWDYKPNEMCPLSGAAWGDGASAGVWALNLGPARSDSGSGVGCRAALYL